MRLQQIEKERLRLKQQELLRQRPQVRSEGVISVFFIKEPKGFRDMRGGSFNLHHKGHWVSHLSKQDTGPLTAHPLNEGASRMFTYDSSFVCIVLDPKPLLIRIYCHTALQRSPMSHAW